VLNDTLTKNKDTSEKTRPTTNKKNSTKEILNGQLSKDGKMFLKHLYQKPNDAKALKVVPTKAPKLLSRNNTLQTSKTLKGKIIENDIQRTFYLANTKNEV